jgi:1-acyl-sn-glycerol-3-phosphate acyltransferase
MTDRHSRSLARRLAYDALRVSARLATVLVFQLRCRGRKWAPRQGAALVCSNHQSYLDPLLVGLAFDRRLNYLARNTLFRWGPFRWFIEFLDAIPVDRGGGAAGLKEALRRLKRGELVLVFPEGTRSQDGGLAPFKAGLTSLVRRCEASLIPVGLDGAFEAWPRSRCLPRTAIIHVEIGEPISPELSATLSNHVLLEELERRVRGCYERARRARARCSV